MLYNVFNAPPHIRSGVLAYLGYQIASQEWWYHDPHTDFLWSWMLLYREEGDCYEMHISLYALNANAFLGETPTLPDESPEGLFSWCQEHYHYVVSSWWGDLRVSSSLHCSVDMREAVFRCMEELGRLGYDEVSPLPPEHKYLIWTSIQLRTLPLALIAKGRESMAVPVVSQTCAR